MPARDDNLDLEVEPGDQGSTVGGPDLTEPADLGVGVERFQGGRLLTERERRHPLAESGWRVSAASSLDGEVDALLIEKPDRQRFIELYEDYAWVREHRRLTWDEFAIEQAHFDDRPRWAEAIADKLALFGLIVPAPGVYLARNDEYGADWVLGLEV